MQNICHFLKIFTQFWIFLYFGSELCIKTYTTIFSWFIFCEPSVQRDQFRFHYLPSLFVLSGFELTVTVGNQEEVERRKLGRAICIQLSGNWLTELLNDVGCKINTKLSKYSHNFWHFPNLNHITTSHDSFSVNPLSREISSASIICHPLSSCIDSSWPPPLRIRKKRKGDGTADSYYLWESLHVNGCFSYGIVLLSVLIFWFKYRSQVITIDQMNGFVGPQLSSFNHYTRRSDISGLPTIDHINVWQQEVVVRTA